MHDGDVASRYAVYSDVSRLVALTGRVREEEEVTAVERRFHRAAVNTRFVNILYFSSTPLRYTGERGWSGIE